MTIRDKIKPFVIVDFFDGASLQLYSVEDYKQELFDSRKTEGFTGNGYDWTALAKLFIAEKCPHIADEISFDPDYGMFTVYSDSAELLESFAADFKAALDDDDFIYPFFLRLEAAQKQDIPTFRPMRRSRQQLSDDAAEEILRCGSSGVLALCGDNGYPYAVPMSYVYNGGKIYFHCAGEGHKLDAMRRCEKASFCVIAEDTTAPELFTAIYKSVIAFGKISFAESVEYMTAAARLLADKYCPHNSEESFIREMDRYIDRLCIPVLTVEHLTGKEAKELMNTDT